MKEKIKAIFAIIITYRLNLTIIFDKNLFSFIILHSNSLYLSLTYPVILKRKYLLRFNWQIELIKNQSRGLIEQVDGYQKEKLSSLVEYIERSNQTKTNLEEVMKQSHQFCQKEQTLMIREHENELDKLNKWNGAYSAAGCDTTIKRRLRIGI